MALFVALGGSAYAASQLPAKSVGKKQLRTGAVTSKAVLNGSLQALDFGANQLPQGQQGLQGPPGPPGLSGVHLVAVDSAFDTATNPKVVTAPCDAGEVAIAGGGQVFTSSAADTVALRTSGPVVGGNTQPTGGVPTGWRVNAVAIGAPGNWSGRAYAICAHTTG